MGDITSIPTTSLLGRVLRAPLRLIPRGAVVPIVRGPLRGKRWVAGSHIHSCWLGGYEADKQSAFADAIKPGAVVYDIGANVGFYTLLSATLAGPNGKVYAFEPLPRNLGLLRRHVALNSLGTVEVIAAAVSDREGEATFDDSAPTAMGSLSERGSLKVRTVAIDELVAQGRLKPPDVVKIDVEGAEGHVLAGASKTLAAHLPTLFLATHGREIHASCLATLKTLGYSQRPLGSGDLEASDEVLAVRP